MPVVGGRTFSDYLFLVLLVVVPVYVCVHVWTEEGTGYLSALLGALSILMGMRNNVATVLLSISFERALFWHKIAAVMSIVVGAIHAAISIYQRLGQVNVIGAILLALMVVTSFSYVIKYLFFEGFYYIHVAVFFFIIVFSFIHGATAMGVAGCAWLVDLLVRYWWAATQVEATITALPADVIRISFAKPFAYAPGQFCFVCVPALSSWQYHPLSFSSAPHEPEVSLHVRVLGNWTRQLQELAQAHARAAAEGTADPQGSTLAAVTPLKVQIHVEGPMGLPSVDLSPGAYQVYLLITGGIGNTPAQSILSHLARRYETTKNITGAAPAFRKVIFVWAAKVRDG